VEASINEKDYKLLLSQQGKQKKEDRGWSQHIDIDHIEV